ncbi:UNVERIFIED_CONTAM: hypothetical protein GTU68_021205 [Idotea baltica]|nr:hypothetical protein [Idotea baltica]
MSCDRDGAAVVAEEVRAAIEAIRFDWDDRTFSVTASIGLVLVTEDSEDLAEVLMHADAACYRAKDRGRNRVQLFDTDIVALSEREGEMRWISHITKALDDNGFYLVAQPIACLSDENGSSSRGCERFEMLLRMRTSAGENVSPGLFLPAAERYHIATRLDRWVVAATFDWMTDSKNRLEQIGLCSINLSGHSITDESFLRDLLQRLEQDPRVGSKLCFEITETAAMNNIDAAVEFIEKVQEMGCTFALDDFGSGSASFGYLKSLPVDFVKIDGVFVRDMLNNDVDLAMVKAINDIGHIMGKQTIAEFVETTAVAERLKSMGVDFAQGYATGVPAPLDDLFKAPKKNEGGASQSGPEAA